MQQLHILHPLRPHDKEELILVAFRLDPSHDGPQFYTLLAVGGENERPPMADGRILFFAQPELAAKVAALDPSLSGLGAPAQQVESVCDVSEALYLVNSQDSDPDGVILDCLLILDDLVRATRLNMPERYQSLLTELAARLTEHRPLGKIFSNRSLREHVEDALLWCVGAIAVKTKMVNG